MNALTQPPRLADHPVDPMFVTRHSARAFTDATIDESDLLSILEAARWAPSGANVQPTRIAWALRGDAAVADILASLADGNRVWAERAAALLVVASKDHVEKEGERLPHVSAAFDAGAAWMSLALQAHLMGWVAHAMGGFDKAGVARRLGLPDGHTPHVVVAIGRKGDAASLPEHLRPREVPNGRMPLDQIARRGGF